MSERTDPRVGEIRAKLGGLLGIIAFPETPEERDAAEKEIAADVAYLLAELADRDEKLARVEGLAERWAGLDNSPAARSSRIRTLRAAVAAAKGESA